MTAPRPDNDSLGLSRTALALVRDLVHDRTGVFYENGRCDALADRLGPLVAGRGFSSFLDYYYFLKYDATSASEWEQILDALAVPETYFWREIDQLHAIVDVLIPSLVEHVHDRPIRIWSVPCATGEEPLTMAMLLDRAGWYQRAAIDIMASDASAAALQTARRGLYRERSFRTLPLTMRDRYFVRERDRWRVDPGLQGRVRGWTRVNLLDADVAAACANADIILCRNLFIYFSEQSIRRVVNMFADHMPATAYLCVGAAESLLRITDRFALEEIGQAFVYAKRSHEQKDTDA
jgi:chemotaxis protein methyltransferase CheR